MPHLSEKVLVLVESSILLSPPHCLRHLTCKTRLVHYIISFEPETTFDREEYHHQEEQLNIPNSLIVWTVLHQRLRLIIDTSNQVEALMKF